MFTQGKLSDESKNIADVTFKKLWHGPLWIRQSKCYSPQTNRVKLQGVPKIKVHRHMFSCATTHTN